MIVCITDNTAAPDCNNRLEFTSKVLCAIVSGTSSVGIHKRKSLGKALNYILTADFSFEGHN